MHRETGRLGSQGPLIKGLVPTRRTSCFILRVLDGSLGGSVKVSWGREGPKEAGTILRSPGSSGVSPPVTHPPMAVSPSCGQEHQIQLEGPGAQRSLASPSEQSPWKAVSGEVSGIWRSEVSANCSQWDGNMEQVESSCHLGVSIAPS